MKTITQYREEIKAMLKQADDMAAQATAENRDFTDAEISARKNLFDVVKSHELKLSDLEEREKIENRLATPAKPLTVDGNAKIEVGIDRATKERFASKSEFFMAVAKATMPRGHVDPRLYNATGLNETVPSEGGFLVQTDIANELARDLIATDLLAARCDRRQISGPSNSVKIYGFDETSRASTRSGGTLAYWKGEGAEKSKSKPAFREIQLTLNKLIGLCYATDEVLADAAMLETAIRNSFVAEFGFRRDDAIINGTGAGQPLGILNAGCLVTVAKESGQTADTVLAENIFKMYARQMNPSNAVWLVNQTVWPQLFQMSISVGTGGAPIFLPAGGINQSPFNTLMGRPIIPCEQCAALGDVGDIIFANLGGYILAEKGGIDSAMSIHVNFVYDESVFRFVMRMDGQPWRASALTPYKGTSSNSLSDFVALAAR